MESKKKLIYLDDARRSILHLDPAMVYCIDNVPTVDAVEVVHAKWTFNKDGSGTCCHCHFTQLNVWDYDNHQRYCGVCGAKMDKEN